MAQLKLLNQEKFLDSIMKVSKHLRYVKIYDLKGNNLYNRKMEGVVDLLTAEQNKIAINHTIESWNFRNTLAEKIGKPRYTMQVFENLRRVLFPFGKNMILIVTFDNASGQQNVIERIQKILSGNYAVPRR
jgi:hypothetical protein